jgi:hypothetical protein
VTAAPAAGKETPHQTDETRAAGGDAEASEVDDAGKGSCSGHASWSRRRWHRTWRAAAGGGGQRDGHNAQIPVAAKVGGWETLLQGVGSLVDPEPGPNGLGPLGARHLGLKRLAHPACDGTAPRILTAPAQNGPGAQDGASAQLRRSRPMAHPRPRQSLPSKRLCGRRHPARLRRRRRRAGHLGLPQGRPAHQASTRAGRQRAQVPTRPTLAEPWRRRPRRGHRRPRRRRRATQQPRAPPARRRGRRAEAEALDRRRHAGRQGRAQARPFFPHACCSLSLPLQVFLFVKFFDLDFSLWLPSILASLLVARADGSDGEKNRRRGGLLAPRGERHCCRPVE